MSYSIVTLNQIPTDKIKDFSDKQIGLNYFSIKDLEEIKKMSEDHLGQVSLALIDNDYALKGVRLTLLPPYWIKEVKSKYFTKDVWPKDVSLNNMAYFKSLFIHPEVQNKGWGTKLTQKSIELLKKRDLEAILTYSWLESPNNSSQKYLERLGFKKIDTHPNFWSEIDYLCSGCQKKPCQCTAIEMILKL